MKELPPLENRIYVPISKGKRRRYLELLEELTYCRYPEVSDSNRIRVSVLYVHTKGKGSREAFDFYEITRADFGKVSKIFCDVALYNKASDSYEPKRFERKNGKILIYESPF